MKRLAEHDMTNAPDASTWAGPLLCVALFIAVVAIERGGLNPAGGLGFSGLLVLLGVVWALREADRLRRLSELYLWLAFPLSMYHLHEVAFGLAGWLGVAGIDAYRAVAVVHVLVAGAALGVLGAWTRREEPSGEGMARGAAGLFIVGAVVFWVGARTFPGMTLEVVQAHPEGHRWTSITFILATVVTLAGLGVFTLALRDAGDRLFSMLGLLSFAFGSVFWVLHLAFRLTVMVQAAEVWSAAAADPAWYAPWRAMATLLFGLYSVLAYLGLAAYGGALLKTGLMPRWAGWMCIVAGLLAAPLGGLPLFIHVPLWLVGLLVLRDRAPRTA